TDFGFVYGARRPAGDGENLWRVTTYIMPAMIEIPGVPYRGAVHWTLPMDDEHSWWFNVSPVTPDGVPPTLKEGQLSPGDSDPDETTHHGFIPGTWRRLRNASNDYLIDRELQHTRHY